MSRTPNESSHIGKRARYGTSYRLISTFHTFIPGTKNSMCSYLVLISGNSVIFGAFGNGISLNLM